MREALSFYESFRKLGVPFGILIIRILQFRVLYEGPLLSETRMYRFGVKRAKFSIQGMRSISTLFRFFFYSIYVLKWGFYSRVQYP